METSKNKNEKEQIIEFIQLCFRHWYYFVISGFICLAIGILYIKIKTPVYAVLAKVTLTQDDNLAAGSGVNRSSGILSVFGVKSGGDNIEDETIKLNSQGNIKEVVKTLELNKTYLLSQYAGFSKTNLYGQSPILLEVDSTMADTLLRMVIFEIDVKKDQSADLTIQYGKDKIGQYPIKELPATLNTVLGDFTLSQSPLYPDYATKDFSIIITYTNYDYMAQIYRKALSIDFQKKTSDLINLGMESENTFFAKDVLKAVINTYNKNWILNKEENYNQTIKFINDRLVIAQQELANADNNIEAFKNKNNLTDIRSDITFYFTQSGELQPTLLETENQIQLVNIISSFLEDEANKYNLVPFSLTTSEDPALARLIESYNREVLRRNESLKLSNQPSALNQSLDTKIDALRSNLITSLDNIRKELDTTLKSLKKKDEELNKLIGNIPSAERDYLSLRREQELQQNVYMFLLEKREESAIRYASLNPKLKIIEEPYVLNKPVSPSLRNTALMILFFGGLVIPLSLIYLIPFLIKHKKKRK